MDPYKKQKKTNLNTEARERFWLYVTIHNLAYTLGKKKPTPRKESRR